MKMQKNSPYRHENRYGLLTQNRGRATHSLRHLERGFHDGNVWRPFFLSAPCPRLVFIIETIKILRDVAAELDRILRLHRKRKRCSSA
jgi:hypothetical protein